jgi:hypothetical protein
MYVDCPIVRAREIETEQVVNQRRVRAEIWTRGQAALPISVFETEHPESKRKFYGIVKPAAEKSGIDWQCDAFSGTVWLVPEDFSYIALFFPKHPIITMPCEGISEDFSGLRNNNDYDAIEALNAYRENAKPPTAA